MDAAALLLDARRRAGFSQRALAARAGTSRRVVEDAESGRRSPRSDVLDALLRACDRELCSVPLPASLPEHARELLHRHLRLSLTRRVCRAAGGVEPFLPRGEQPWQQLCRLATCAREVGVPPGPLAWASWAPVDELPSIAEQVLLLRVPLLCALPPEGRDGRPPYAVDLEPGPWPAGLVPVRLPGWGMGRACRSGLLLVPPPVDLVAGAPPGLQPWLEAAAALLHEQAPRDEQGRRPPAHRPVNEVEEARQVRLRFSSPTGTSMPSPYDGRTWRLGAPASLAEEVRRRGLRPLPPKPGWSRWGW